MRNMVFWKDERKERRIWKIGMSNHFNNNIKLSHYTSFLLCIHQYSVTFKHLHTYFSSLLKRRKQYDIHLSVVFRLLTLTTPFSSFSSLHIWHQAGIVRAFVSRSLKLILKPTFNQQSVCVYVCRMFVCPFYLQKVNKFWLIFIYIFLLWYLSLDPRA